MSTDLIQSAYRRTWWALVLQGLLGIVVGGVILWRPLESVAAFALAIALWALFNGVVQIVHAFDLRAVFDRWWVLLLGGLVSIGFGLAACLANNARRPWEPHKYASVEQQNAMLTTLNAWVTDYYHRTDQWSYQAHRRIFDAHTGAKIERTS